MPIFCKTFSLQINDLIAINESIFVNRSVPNVYVQYTIGLIVYVRRYVSNRIFANEFSQMHYHNSRNW